LTMRASRGPVDLQQYQTAIDGDRAYPLVARGAMLGVLVCGSRSSHEPYAPDEADALDRLAQGVGIALDSLRTGHPDGEGAIMSRLDMVQQTLQSMSSRIDALERHDPKTTS
jgi:GAF domain-containing protein